MNLTKKKFIHLSNYTQYSLSKGAIKINELVDLCVKNKIPAVSISDFNNLFGCMEFSIECFNKWNTTNYWSNIFVKDQKLDSGYILLM